MSAPLAWSPYCGAAPTPAQLLERWNFDPAVIVGLMLAAAATAWLWRAQARGFSPPRLLAGWAVLALGFVSPLCALSSALFSARTVHHVLLVGVAAALLAWGLPRSRHPRPARALAVHAALFWSWHAPGAYAWALSDDAAYWLMQFSLLGSALWFWRSVRAVAPPLAVGALLLATLQMGLLGALLTFAEQPLYAPHAATTVAWGLSPLADQQAAGLIMWAPASAIYLAAALGLLGGWLQARRAAPAVA